MSSSKKLTCKETLRQVFNCLRLGTPNPSLTHCIVYVYTVYLFTQGRGDGGRVEPERRGKAEKGNTGEYRSHSFVESTNITECTQEIIDWSQFFL
jgi:hypothetical protein